MKFKILSAHWYSYWVEGYVAVGDTVCLYDYQWGSDEFVEVYSSGSVHLAAREEAEAFVREYFAPKVAEVRSVYDKVEDSIRERYDFDFYSSEPRDSVKVKDSVLKAFSDNELCNELKSREFVAVGMFTEEGLREYLLDVSERDFTFDFSEELFEKVRSEVNWKNMGYDMEEDEAWIWFGDALSRVLSEEHAE